MFLEKWQAVYPREETFAQTNFGVPSVLVRFDCVYGEEGFGAYEIEERPSGVGIALKINAQFANLFGRLREEWPEFSIVVSPRRWKHGGDDHLWAREGSYDEALTASDLLWVRAEPQEREFHRFASRSLSTVATKGDKAYGVALGLWQAVASDEEAKISIKDLPWDQGFFLKPLQGSKTRGISMWLPSVGNRGNTQRDFALHLARQKRGFVQRFIPPMSITIEGKPYNAIWRIFFGWSPKLKQWVPLGGEWDARPAPHYLIHGAPDAIAGPSCLP